MMKPVKFMEFVIKEEWKQLYHTRYENNDPRIPSSKRLIYQVYDAKGNKVVDFMKGKFDENGIPRECLVYTLEDVKRTLKYNWSKWGALQAKKAKLAELKKETKALEKEIKRGLR